MPSIFDPRLYTFWFHCFFLWFGGEGPFSDWHDHRLVRSDHWRAFSNRNRFFYYIVLFASISVSFARSKGSSALGFHCHVSDNASEVGQAQVIMIVRTESWLPVVWFRHCDIRESLNSKNSLIQYIAARFCFANTGTSNKQTISEEENNGRQY